MFTDPTGYVTWGAANLAPITPKDLMFVEAVVEDRISKLKGNVISPLGPTKENNQWAQGIRSRMYQRKFDALQVQFTSAVPAVAHAIGGDKIEVNSKLLIADYKSSRIPALAFFASSIVHEIAHNLQDEGWEPWQSGPGNSFRAAEQRFIDVFGAGSREIDQIKNTIPGSEVGDHNRKKEPYAYYIEGKAFPLPADRLFIPMSLEYANASNFATAYGSPYTAPQFDWSGAAWKMGGELVQPPANLLKATQY
jgi:hypothetical protein